MPTPARVRRRIAEAIVKKIPAAKPTAKPVRRNAAAAVPLPFDLKNLLLTLQAVRDGNFAVRIAGDHEGIEGKIAETLNDIIAANQRLSQEMSRAGQLVGKEGKTRHRVGIDRRSGAWGDMEGCRVSGSMQHLR